MIINEPKIQLLLPNISIADSPNLFVTYIEVSALSILNGTTLKSWFINGIFCYFQYRFCYCLGGRFISNIH